MDNLTPERVLDTALSSTAFGELYSAYAAGTLDPGFALLVETQAALRPGIARAVQAGETLAAALLEAEHPSPLAPDACARALAMIDASAPRLNPPARPDHPAGETMNEVASLPRPLRRAVADSLDQTEWQLTLPGVRRLRIRTHGEAETELYRLEPGASVPRHSHEGAELTLVVTGSFADEAGIFGPGDVSVKGPEHTHQPVASLDGICYALAVRDGGLRFTGLVGAIQRILGH